jgi:hypothetical protein
MRIFTVALAGCLLAGVGGCGAAGLSPGELGVTARDAFLEGRTRAATWDTRARLRWVEGVGISPAGVALPGIGQWRLHYTAPGRQMGLMVVVAPIQTGEEERAPTSPPGFAIGDAALADTFIDSPEVLTRVLAVRGGSIPERATLLLVPTQPIQWVVTLPDETRQWRVDAQTGQVLTP